MSFTIVLDQNLQFLNLKTKFHSNLQFGLQRSEKEWKFPILPSKLDICKNFALKLHRIYSTHLDLIKLVLFESLHDELPNPKRIFPDESSINKNLIFENWALKNQWQKVEHTLPLPHMVTQVRFGGCQAASAQLQHCEISYY